MLALSFSITVKFIFFYGYNHINLKKNTKIYIEKIYLIRNQLFNI